jgi:hemoglobin
MKKDIETRDDIILLVNTFYNSVKENPILAYIFDDVAQVDWNTHLPKMYSFWGSLLLGERNTLGNPMEKHIELSKITKLSGTEFDEWIFLFTNTVDVLFEGKKANDAKQRAANIARLMLFKIQNV